MHRCMLLILGWMMMVFFSVFYRLICGVHLDGIDKDNFRCKILILFYSIHIE